MAMGASILSVPLIGNAFTESDVMAWWSCDEESGTRADSGQYSNDLTDNNTVLYNTGKVSNACDIETSNSEYLSITDASQTGLDLSTQASIVFWFNPEADTSADMFIAKWSETGNYRSYAIGVNPGSNLLYWYSDDNGSAPGYSTSDSVTINASTWYHIAVTYDAGTVKFYVDGAQTAGGDKSVTNTSLYNGGAAFGVNYINLAAGSLDGLIDELVVTDTVLSLTEIQELYASGNGIGYADYFGTGTGTTSTTTESTSTVNVDELKWVVELYLALFMFLIFTYIGYRFTKVFI